MITESNSPLSSVPWFGCLFSPPSYDGNFPQSQLIDLIRSIPSCHLHSTIKTSGSLQFKSKAQLHTPSLVVLQRLTNQENPVFNDPPRT